MQLPAMLQGDSLTRLLQGAAVGAVATMAIGFGWGGWTLNSTAVKMAQQRETAAVVDAYAPVCAKMFAAQADDAKWDAFAKVSTWQRDRFVKDAGFATIPGHKTPNGDVADACAILLGKLLEGRPKT